MILEPVFNFLSYVYSSVMNIDVGKVYLLISLTLQFIWICEASLAKISIPTTRLLINSVERRQADGPDAEKEIRTKKVVDVSSGEVHGREQEAELRPWRAVKRSWFLMSQL